MKYSRRQHGFALLLCLVLVLIAGIALAAAARHSATEALAAREATESLQRRWAVASCRATLLPRVDGILNEAFMPPVDREGMPLSGVEVPVPRAHLWVSCKLAGITYDLVLTDEQAKYNPTMIGLVVDEQQVQLSLDRLVSGRQKKAKGAPRVLLRPLIGLNPDGTMVEGVSAEESEFAHYAGYGQLFEECRPEQLLGSALRPGPVMHVTCWGDGKLNLTRSSRPAIEQTLKPLLTADGVMQLLEARSEYPSDSIDKWLGRVTVATPDNKKLAASLLTLGSHCQGLWVIAHGQTRSWHAYAIRHYTPPKKGQSQQPLPTDPGSDRPAQDQNHQEQDDLPDPTQYYDHAW